MDTHGEKTGIFAKKGLWIGVGTGIFILIAFILPTPQSLVEVMEKYGYVQKMIDWEIAHNTEEATAKTMIVLCLSMSIVGSPANALTFALGVYPDSNKRVLEAIDFVKYGFGFFILSMLLLWLVGFLVIYPIVGFPEGILEQATRVLQSTTH